MIDPFGRSITYLRVSVTDRCDFRCVYCMAEDMTFLPKKDLLSLEELDRLCTVFIEKGVKKLRLTGGGTKSDGFAQVMTDVIGQPTKVTRERECTVFGAAILGAFGSGAFSSIATISGVEL